MSWKSIGILLVLLYVLYLVTSLSHSESSVYQITRVIDGDTVEIKAEFLPPPLPQKLLVRLLGVDTPEKAPRAHCKDENLLSLKAKLFTEEQISRAEKVEVVLMKWDKFGGRVLGDIILDGKKLSQLLIDRGLAIAYNGERKTHDWCKHEH